MDLSPGSDSVLSGNTHVSLALFPQQTRFPGPRVICQFPGWEKQARDSFSGTLRGDFCPHRKCRAMSRDMFWLSTWRVGAMCGCFWLLVCRDQGSSSAPYMHRAPPAPTKTCAAPSVRRADVDRQRGAHATGPGSVHPG